MATTQVSSSVLKDGAVTSAKLDTNIAIDGNLTVDTNTLYVDSANNRVGIGTTSPSYKLDVVGAGRFSSTLLIADNTAVNFGLSSQIYHNSSNAATHFTGESGANTVVIKDGGNVGIGTSSPSALLHVSGSSPIIQTQDTDGTNQIGRMYQFGTDLTLSSRNNTSRGSFSFQSSNGTDTLERLRIDSSGNVGIGTASPASKLTTYGSADTIVSNVEAPLAINNSVLFGVSDTEATKAGIGFTKKDGFRRGDLFLFNNNTANDSTDGSASDARLTITSGGNVGIGTTSPSGKLEIYSSTLNNQLYLVCPDTGQAGINFGGTSAKTKGRISYSDNSDLMFFQTNSAEQMRIDSSGNVLIGTTDAAISGSFTNSGASILSSGRITSTSISQSAAIFNRITTDGDIVIFRRQASQVGSISVTGSATAYNTSSDYRLKEDWVDMEGALDRVDALKPINFAWKADGSRADGFLAHEVADVVPEAISGEKDAVDEEGNEIYQGIDQSKLVPLLVGAIQELKAEIETLKSQINN